MVELFCNLYNLKEVLHMADEKNKNTNNNGNKNPSTKINANRLNFTLLSSDNNSKDNKSVKPSLPNAKKGD